MTLGERSALPGLEVGRADVTAVGALILGEILRWLGVEELTASDRGVRWGLLRDEQAALR
jgi:exopolyphosphatase/guanosine-5'-triphosphate,3'-diphosphate pyrophosphatase